VLLAMASLLSTVWRRLNNPRDVSAATAVAACLLVAEAVLCVLVVWKVPYTEIDWVAYMEEVEGYLQGETDYTKLAGGTGPLVYPAGFVHIYSALHWLTGGGDILIAQVVFVCLYLATQAVVMAIYIRARLTPPWALALLCLSKRLHSIYVLRLFNDCFAAFFAYLGTLALMAGWIRIAVVLFSAGVSIKMNVLLMAPPVLAVAIKMSNPGDLFQAVLLGGALQVVLAIPFLATYPWGYLSRAFELSRVFQYKWTVNLKFLPEDVFTSPWLAMGLLSIHIVLLFAWAFRKWFAADGGVGNALANFLKRTKIQQAVPRRAGQPARKAHLGNVPGAEVAVMVFTGNFIGVATARTLHYQFYSWYCHTIPLMLWATPLPTIARVAIWALIEWAFNVFPATPVSSGVLCGCHGLLILALWAARREAEKVHTR